MKYQRILVPYDGSEHSHAAFATARNLALASDDAIIYVINVVPMSVASSIELTEPQEQDDPAAARNEVYTQQFDDGLKHIQHEMRSETKGLLDGLTEDCVKIEAIAYRSVVQGIADYAKDRDCDLIVMGRRGLGAVLGMLGSVSYGVLRSVDIPVMTVK